MTNLFSSYTERRTLNPISHILRQSWHPKTLTQYSVTILGSSLSLHCFSELLSVHWSFFSCPWSPKTNEMKIQWSQGNTFILTLYTKKSQWFAKELGSWATTKVRTSSPCHHFCTENSCGLFYGKQNDGPAQLSEFRSVRMSYWLLSFLLIHHQNRGALKTLSVFQNQVSQKLWKEPKHRTNTKLIPTPCIAVRERCACFK